MAINTSLESTDEMKQIFGKVRSFDNPGALPIDRQEKYDKLNKAQFTSEYPGVLNQVRKELLSI